MIEFIGLLNFKKFACCSVHIFDEAIFYYFGCDVYFLLSDKNTLNTGCLLNI